MTADEIRALRASGYQPYEHYDQNPALKEALDLISSGHFSGGDRELFRPLVDSLKYHDEYFVLADFQSYVDCQQTVSHAWADQRHWSRMSILNTARMGYFSSDRTITDYCRDIWKVKPFPVKLVNLG